MISIFCDFWHAIRIKTRKYSKLGYQLNIKYNLFITLQNSDTCIYANIMLFLHKNNLDVPCLIIEAVKKGLGITILSLIHDWVIMFEELLFVLQ